LSAGNCLSAIRFLAYLSVMQRLLKLVLIVLSSASLIWGFFDLTKSMIPALSWGATYFAVRATMECSRRGLPRGRKLAMAALSLMASAIHASAGLAHSYEAVTLRATPLEAVVYGLAFLGPEVILWAIEDPPHIPGLLYRVHARCRRMIRLSAVPACFLEICFQEGMHRSFDSACLEVKILDRTGHLVQDLGLVSQAGAFSSLPLVAGNYSVIVVNHCRMRVDVRVWVYVRPL
jgi:hypothetical protein